MLLDQIKNIAHAEEKTFRAIKASSVPVVLFGAGEIAYYIWKYLRDHGIEPAVFCDNNPAKQGTTYLGLPVFDYNSLKKKMAGSGGRYTIVVATGIQHKEAISLQLAEEGEKNPVWYVRGYEVCGEKTTYSFIRKHASLFEEAYASLADDLSRKTLVNVLNAKLSGDFSLYDEVKAGTEYFDEDIVHLTDREVLVDVGAYRGNVFMEFEQRTRRAYEAIIVLEPDKKNLSILKDVIAKRNIQRIEIYNKGAWDKPGVLHFHPGREGSSCIAQATDDVSVVTDVAVDTIDAVLHGRRVTYITMDIEGAERKAILGARQAIKKWKPRLAVCVYHKREDLYDLLLLIKSLCPAYKFYLRHYTSNQTDTVLYAV